MAQDDIKQDNNNKIDFVVLGTVTELTMGNKSKWTESKDPRGRTDN